MATNTLKTFMVGSFGFRLVIDTEADDVELLDEGGEVLLTFTSDLVIFSSSGLVGSIHLCALRDPEGKLTGEAEWRFYEGPVWMNRVLFKHAELYDLEADVSKWWIATHGPAEGVRETAIESEGGHPD